VIAEREVDMVDKKSDTAKVAILPGVELTPEAQAILNKQLNRRIVWSYKATRATLIVLSLSPLLISAFFAYGAAVGGVNNLGHLALAAALVCIPAIASFGLFKLASRF
jgi:hypothetical protein